MVLESGIEVGSRRTRTYRAEVRYRYRVDGRSYEGTRLYFAGLPMATDSDGARGMLAGLAPGRTVAVAYDPARPERAVLRPGIGPPTRLSVAAGAAFLGFGLLCLVLEWRAERGHERLPAAHVAGRGGRRGAGRAVLGLGVRLGVLRLGRGVSAAHPPLAGGGRPPAGAGAAADVSRHDAGRAHLARRGGLRVRGGRAPLPRPPGVAVGHPRLRGAAWRAGVPAPGHSRGRGAGAGDPPPHAPPPRLPGAAGPAGVGILLALAVLSPVLYFAHYGLG